MCFADDSHPPIPLSAGSAAHGHDLKLTASDGTQVMAYLAETGESPKAGVLLLPDVRGLHNFYRELALRFADVGIRALAIDYFARTAPSEARDDSFEYMPHVQQLKGATLGQDIAAGLETLRSRAALPTFTVGFCLGGSLSLWAGTRGSDLAGVIGFYAGLNKNRGDIPPVLDWASTIQSPVLGLFGGADPSIPVEDRDTLERELTRGGVEHEIIVYPDAPHSFFDRKAAEFATASADAWSRIQGFIDGHSRVRV